MRMKPSWTRPTQCWPSTLHARCSTTLTQSFNRQNEQRINVRTIEIESWALRMVAAVEAGHQIEDSRVELKAELPDAVKAARRIAAHANSAFSEPILWLIGIDENFGIKGTQAQELAD